MCGGIEYQEQKIYFPQPGARLPVRLRDGNVTWVTWGRREKEAVGKFPNGGWARLNSIKNGKWKPWMPRPVLIAADQFMEKDREGQSHWIELVKKMVIQGLLAERNNEHRVYIVTVNTPPEHAWMAQLHHSCHTVPNSTENIDTLISLIKKATRSICCRFLRLRSHEYNRAISCRLKLIDS